MIQATVHRTQTVDFRKKKCKYNGNINVPNRAQDCTVRHTICVLCMARPQHFFPGQFELILLTFMITKQATSTSGARHSRLVQSPRHPHPHPILPLTHTHTLSSLVTTTHLYIYIYIYTHTHTYIYLFIYVLSLSGQYALSIFRHLLTRGRGPILSLKGNVVKSLLYSADIV